MICLPRRHGPVDGTAPVPCVKSTGGLRSGVVGLLLLVCGCAESPVTPAPDGGPACDAIRDPATGLCVAGCTEGLACTTNPSAPCRLGVISCASATPACVDGAPVDAGVTCGEGRKCDGAGGCLAVPTCEDEVLNGAETDVDCGPGCPLCANGKRCDDDANCLESLCVQGRCTQPPTLDVDGPVTAPEGTPIAFTVRSSTPIGAEITFRYATSDGTAVSPIDYATTIGTGTIAADAGSTIVSVPTVDRDGFQVSRTFTLTVSQPTRAWIGVAQEDGTITDTEPAPSEAVYSPSSLECTKGVPCEIAAPVHAGGTPTDFGVSPALPAGMMIDPATGAISGTPTTLSPSTTYTITVSNGAGATTTLLTIVVNDAPITAVTYAPSTAVCTAGTVCEIAAPSITGGAAVSFDVTPEIPAGLAFDLSTGAISGTANTASPVTTYTVTATNSGGSKSTILTLSVVPGPASAAASTLVALPASVVANGSATTTLTFTLRDANSNAIPAVSVTASASGTANSFGRSEGVTDAAGVFATTLASTVPEVKTVTVTAGAVSATTTVTFTCVNPALTACAGICTNLQTDAANCNACGSACPELCSAGICVTDFEWSRWTTPETSPSPAVYATTSDTVTDNATGLVWQRTAAPATMTNAAGVTYCDGLTLGGSSDWRLPTSIELVSILNYGTANPAIDTTAFPATPKELFWTASPNVFAPGNARVVDFAQGGAGTAAVNNAFRVRCVR